MSFRCKEFRIAVAERFWYDYAGHTYAFYLTEHGRDSLDGAGMTIISTVRYCDPSYACPYANAFWSSQYDQIAYGQGYAAADDVVGHELTHGVTDFTSNLFYYYESGDVFERCRESYPKLTIPINNPVFDWILKLVV